MVEAAPASNVLELAEKDTEEMSTTLLGSVRVDEADGVFEEPSGFRVIA